MRNLGRNTLAQPALVLGVILLLGGWDHTWAQDNDAAVIDARRNFTFASEDLMLPTFAPESQADQDLGVQLLLQPREEYDPFTVSAYTGYAFTNNANLSDTDRQEDHIWMMNAAISYVPVLKRNLYGEATVRSYTFRYNADSGLNFNSYDFGGGLIYVLRALGDVSTYARYNYTDFAGADGVVTNFYRNHALETGLFKNLILTRNQSLYLSYQTDLSLDGDPGFAKRDEHGLTVAYRVTPMTKVKAELFYRAAFLDFDEGDREDWNHASGASLTYNFTPHIYLSGHVSWTDNNSNLALGGDYEAWSPGIRLGGYWRF